MESMFDATIHHGVAKGSCVMLAEHEIVYAGPLDAAQRPDAAGKVILLHPDDFATLAEHVSKTRH